MDTFARFYSKQIVDRGLLNREGSPFFRDAIKDGQVHFVAPHGCWDVEYAKVSQNGEKDDEDRRPPRRPSRADALSAVTVRGGQQSSFPLPRVFANLP